MSHRLYTFGNFYLSSIQQGIQAAHAAVEMANKYPAVASTNSQAQAEYVRWATQDKTMICKNGGAEGELQAIKQLFSDAAEKNNLPWSFFHEEDVALNNALTCVAIVVPEQLWDTGVAYFKSPNVRATFDKRTGEWCISNLEANELLQDYTVFEWKLIELICNSPNAR